MELSIGIWVHEPWTWFVLLDIVLKETQAASGLMRMVWGEWASWGIHFPTMLLPLARAVCHIHISNQQHKPNLIFSQDVWTASQISPVPCIMPVYHQVQIPPGKRHSSAHGHLQISSEAAKGHELISSLKISDELMQKRLEIPESSTPGVIN